MEENKSRPEATFAFQISEATSFFSSDDYLLSDPCYVRNLPWRIIAIPRSGPDPKSKGLGFFVECNGESTTKNWSCNATVELRLLSQRPGINDLAKEVKHIFFPKFVSIT